MSTETLTSLVPVGKVGKAHGIRGEMRLWPFDLSSELLFEVEDVFIGPEKKKPAAFHVEGCRTAKGGKCLVLALREVQDRSRAETLCNQILYVRESALEDLDDDAFYHKDLIGLPAMVGDEKIGEVEEIHDNGAHDVILLRGNDGQEILIPFIEGMVDVFGDEEKLTHLELTPPEGLLDINVKTPKDGEKAK